MGYVHECVEGMSVDKFVCLAALSKSVLLRAFCIWYASPPGRWRVKRYSNYSTCPYPSGCFSSFIPHCTPVTKCSCWSYPCCTKKGRLIVIVLWTLMLAWERLRAFPYSETWGTFGLHYLINDQVTHLLKVARTRRKSLLLKSQYDWFLLNDGEQQSSDNACDQSYMVPVGPHDCCSFVTSQQSWCHQWSLSIRIFRSSI